MNIPYLRTYYILSNERQSVAVVMPRLKRRRSTSRSPYVIEGLIQGLYPPRVPVQVFALKITEETDAQRVKDGLGHVLNPQPEI